MASYMAEVAKMLGVELGEEFYIKEMPNVKCKMHENGLYVYHVKDCACSLPRSREILSSLLTGEVAIKHKSWNQKKNGTYYYINAKGIIRSALWDPDSGIDINYYKLGNCYRTYEEAEANRDKWAAFYASDEVLEV